jgi:hypothetical protein
MKNPTSNTEPLSKELKEHSSEFRYLSNQLGAVSRGGNFNVTQLLKNGLIKKYTIKKGRLEQGIIIGKKEKFILTEKGKRMLRTLRGLGY